MKTYAPEWLAENAAMRLRTLHQSVNRRRKLAALLLTILLLAAALFLF